MTVTNGKTGGGGKEKEMNDQKVNIPEYVYVYVNDEAGQRICEVINDQTKNSTKGKKPQEINDGK